MQTFAGVLLVSKYDRLKTFLKSRREDELRLSFAEVENVLGFALPRSARDHRPWWANNPGTHVGVRAWRDAGWKTAQVDMTGEQVTFVREAEPGRNGGRSGPPLEPAGVGETGVPFDSEFITLDPNDLSRSALRLIEATAEEIGGSRAEAAARLLDWVVLERRRQMLEAFRAKAGPLPPGEPDSVELIRRDRDRDER
jgi:hypothetical protein